MIALFFEVTPRSGRETDYLDTAAALRPHLDRSGGVDYLDRFRSLSRPETLLSHQIWQDEASLARWRAQDQHHAAQSAGRTAILADYRLRVGVVVASLAEDRSLLVADPGIAYNDPARQPARHAVVVRSKGRIFASSDGEAWQSVYTAGSFAWLGAVSGRATGEALLVAAASDPCVSAAHLVLLSRDYGMFDRREAPQYFPSVGRA